MAIRPISEAVNAAKEHLENLSIEELKAEMAENPDLLVVDIREIQERVDSGTIPGRCTHLEGCWSSGQIRAVRTDGTGSARTGGRCCSAPRAGGQRWRLRR